MANIIVTNRSEGTTAQDAIRQQERDQALRVGISVTMDIQPGVTGKMEHRLGRVPQNLTISQVNGNLSAVQNLSSNSQFVFAHNSGASAIKLVVWVS